MKVSFSIRHPRPERDTPQTGPRSLRRSPALQQVSIQRLQRTPARSRRSAAGIDHGSCARLCCCERRPAAAMEETSVRKIGHDRHVSVQLCVWLGDSLLPGPLQRRQTNLDDVRETRLGFHHVPRALRNAHKRESHCSGNSGAKRSGRRAICAAAAATSAAVALRRTSPGLQPTIPGPRSPRDARYLPPVAANITCSASRPDPERAPPQGAAGALVWAHSAMRLKLICSDAALRSSIGEIQVPVRTRATPIDQARLGCQQCLAISALIARSATLAAVTQALAKGSNVPTGCCRASDMINT